MITANSWFRMPWRTWLHGRIYRQAKRFQFPIQSETVEEEPLVAFVSRGAWLVQCPDCRGVEYAWEEKSFFCLSCNNSGVSHRIRRAVFPDQRKEIEALLEVRPLMNRNWYGESLEELAKENEEHKEELLTIDNSSKGG